MITPYRVYQHRITDNDDEIDFVAICEPSANDRMVAGKYPKIILVDPGGKRPEYGETRKILSHVFLNMLFSVSAFLERFPQNRPETCAWLQSHPHGRFSNFSSLPSPSSV
jgi:hypothetical protein